MNKLNILDCTLRDGGYVNNWNFGNKIIRKILKGLSNAHIDIVEVGFLSDVNYNGEQTIYSSQIQLKELLPEQSNCKYVAMIALGEKEISYEKVGVCEEDTIWGIRLTFHKNEIERSFEFAQNLMNKGYQIFMQPIGTCTYSDKELLELVEKINNLNPYAFSIVDTLGTITGPELIRLFHLVDKNIRPSVALGFHSHNNLQLSFSNAQELVHMFSKREVIIDASVLGMGRGAGNLCTELIAQYMNEKLGSNYNVTALLEIVDKYLLSIKEEHPWGYSIPYYIAAINKCHPNYATFLMNLQTVNVEDIEKIIASIPSSKRAVYDKNCISELYRAYQNNFVDDRENIYRLSNILRDKNILILAPGLTLVTEEDKIRDYIHEKNPYIVSVNFCSEIYSQDMIFISNLKRFENFDFDSGDICYKELVVTSNISVDCSQDIYKINYSSYLNSEQMIADNAGLMLLNFLCECGVKKVALAGFDGFNVSAENNFYNKKLYNNVEADMLLVKTEKIGEQIRRLKQKLDIFFVTQTYYEKE